MKFQSVFLAALLAALPQAPANEMEAREPSSYTSGANSQTSQLSANFLDLCGELEEEQAKSCASACAASGKDYKFESTICGIGSTCKCI